MLKWKDGYATGIPSIDEQHQELFAIGNKMYELLENDMQLDKYDRIMEIVGELKDYTRYHFQSEEEYMLSIGHPGYLVQKVEHADFIKRLDSIDPEDLDENQDQKIRELLDLLFNWVLEHILKRDKKIGQEG